MKTAIKTAIQVALVGAALIGGAAQAQIVTNTPTTTGGSDLVLFVSDLSKGLYFVQDLGNPLDSIVPKSSIVSSKTPGSFSLPASFSQTDATLASFLGTTASGDTVDYSIMAADHTSTTEGLGSQRFLMTSPHDVSGGNPIGSQQPFYNNSNVNTAAIGLNSLVKFVNTNYTSNSSTLSGWGDTTAEGTVSDGKNAPLSWISASVGNGATIGTLQKLFLYATNGTGLSSTANVYLGGTVDISSAGVITYTAPSTVPLPAAVWLFGSGLLGLIGVGRRRNNVAA